MFYLCFFLRCLKTGTVFIYYEDPEFLKPDPDIRYLGQVQDSGSCPVSEF